jgi:MFS family permease
MADYEENAQTPDFKDRKTGLIIFGILQILLGALCALMVPLMVLGMVVSLLADNASVTPTNPTMMLPSILFYVLLAAWFITMGVGSLKARRWARALILTSSWLWLVCGICGLTFFLLFMPGMYDSIAETGEMPRGVILVMKCVMTVFMTILYVLIPGSLVLFYRSSHVKATCRSRDPQPRWTDKCPLPVLALSMMFTLWTVSLLTMGVYGWTFPFFGTILTGIPGAALVLTLILCLAYLARSIYRLSINAWWCALLLTIAWAVSTAVTFSRVSILDLYKKMNMPEQQLESMRQFMPHSSTMILMFALSFAAFFAYLLYTKKFFKPNTPPVFPNEVEELV